MISLFWLHNITQWKWVNWVRSLFFAQKNLSGKPDYWQFIWTGFRTASLQTGGSLVLGANHSKLSAATLGRAAEDTPSSFRFFCLFFSALCGIFCFDCQWLVPLRIVRDVHATVCRGDEDKGDGAAVFSSPANMQSHLSCILICVA